MPSPITTRRTLAKGAAWAAPALTVLGAAPVLAASPGPNLTTTITPTSTTTYPNVAQTVNYTATNSGTRATTAPTTLTIPKPTDGSTLTPPATLPAGWVLTSNTSSGYTFTYAGNLAAGQSAPAIPMTYTPTTAGTKTLTSSVSGGGESATNATDNTATATITVAADCTAKPWDAYLEYTYACTSTNCQLVYRICASTVCGNTAVPSGTAMTITLKNNGSTSDSISKATGSGYTIVSSTGGAPANGGKATLAAGGTWTYNITTSASIPAGSCIQFAFNNVDPGRSITMTSTSAPDGVTSNSTNCSKTATLSGSVGNIALC